VGDPDAVVVESASDDAFAGLFAAHYPDLLRYAIRRVGADEAPDVVSDVFLVAWRRRAELPTDAPRLWLFGVASRVVSNHVRSGARQRRLQLRLVAALPPEPSDDPAERVRAALAQLRPDEQELLRLTEWEQLTPAEAATVLGCSPGALRVRLHRARRHLAAALGRSSGPSEEGVSR
jgi:RNA polymerase sigma-70 factor (ECF subfamily)